jgi:hypothetical protein
MHNMLVSLGVIGGKKINVLPAFKAPEAPATDNVEAAPAAEAPAAEAAPEATEAPAEAPAEAAAEAPAEQA